MKLDSGINWKPRFRKLEIFKTQNYSSLQTILSHKNFEFSKTESFSRFLRLRRRFLAWFQGSKSNFTIPYMYTLWFVTSYTNDETGIKNLRRIWLYFSLSFWVTTLSVNSFGKTSKISSFVGPLLILNSNLNCKNHKK